MFVPEPTATHILPFHAIPNPSPPNISVPSPVQVTPSSDHAIVFVPFPTATHILPFHATLFPCIVNIISLVIIVEFSPLGTNIGQFHTILFPFIVDKHRGLSPLCKVTPSSDHAIEYAPFPTVTHILGIL